RRHKSFKLFEVPFLRRLASVPPSGEASFPLFLSSAFFSTCSVLVEKMRDLGLESDFPVVVAADLAGVNVWRRFFGGFASSAGFEDCSHYQSDAVERASGFTSVRWHLSLMRVALLHGAVRTEVLSLGSSARALSGDDWWWCFNGGGFQRSAFVPVWLLPFLALYVFLAWFHRFRSGSSSALICSIEAMVVTVWNRGGDLALATLLHPWEMILEATIA
ncbi:hypothetical protein HID58_037392, partial [Brassica napus]